ncbi:hypothetical protein LNTAR_11886 [Lentisphaera araneosa HTCC2155]|uniref:Uncharacterized protein n=1 Tax=Lentisphaera araneosa HTCC2155 TaxID=313628 RepID=A6DJH8_9BACT|nr:phytochelatin synthase family protein [Lentisphaera araneosa]EDM28052.1 hypothetical protein LNTAR_11886 [Lentisphaera araneosa HTCC2155]
MKYVIIGIILNVFLTSCGINETASKLALNKYDHVVNLNAYDIQEQEPDNIETYNLESTDNSQFTLIKYDSNDTQRDKIQILTNEISDNEKRGRIVNYNIESLVVENNEFVQKNLSTEIKSYKEISFNDIHESINLLVSQYHESKTIDYSQTLKLFQSHLKSYSQSNDILLFNIDQKSFYGAEAEHDTFSVMASYDFETENVLLIEVNEGNQKQFWVHYKNLFDNIMLRKNDNCCTSGWLRISKTTPFTEYYSKLK